MENSRLVNLIDEFVSLSIEYGKYSDKGDHKKVNKIHREINKIYKKIIKNEGSGINQLFNLMGHSDAYVRLWAASVSLPYKIDKAEKVLRDLMDSGGIAGLYAEAILDMWKSGKLKFE